MFSCLTLPWRGRVGALCAPGWGERQFGCPTPLVPKRTEFGLWAAVKLCVYQFKNAINIVRDLIVPEADDAVAFGVEPCRAFGVSMAAVCRAVLGAIDFHDEMGGGAREVDDVIADWHLTSEVGALHCELLEAAP